MNKFSDKISGFFNGGYKEYVAFWLDVGLNLIIIIGLVFLIRTYIMSPFQVYGPSMCNTLNYFNGQCQNSYGEYLIVNKFIYQNILGLQIGLPERGDIIVFHPPQNNEEYYIKRIIGLPGETVSLKDGFVYIYNEEQPEGFKLEETYLNDENLGSTNPHINDLRTFEIPSGGYFVLGDNRLHSSDSRSCFTESTRNLKCGENGNSPFLSLANIEGKAAVILWPPPSIALIADPQYNI
jgi:signal peptidase I